MQTHNPPLRELTSTMLDTITRLGVAQEINPNDRAFRYAWEIGVLTGVIKSLADNHPTTRSMIETYLLAFKQELEAKQTRA